MPLLSGDEPTKHYRVVSVFLDRNISTLGCRFPTFHRTRTCFYLTRRSRKGGSQVGDGASGTESASGGGWSPRRDLAHSQVPCWVLYNHVS